MRARGVDILRFLKTLGSSATVRNARRYIGGAVKPQKNQSSELIRLEEALSDPMEASPQHVGNVALRQIFLTQLGTARPIEGKALS